MCEEQTNDTNEAKPPSKTCSDIVADWLIVYAKVYQEILSEELVEGFKLSLAECLDLQSLHRAFLRAMQRSKFRPKPAEILDEYNLILTNAPRPKELPEPTEEPMTEREAAEYNAAMNRIRQQLTLPAKTVQHDVDFDARRRELLNQRDQVLARFPRPA